MFAGHVTASAATERFLPSGWVDERIQAEKHGDRIGLKSFNYPTRLKMATNDIVTTTNIGEWEKFQIVLLDHPFKYFIDQTVGLYNIHWFRYVQMMGNARCYGSHESETKAHMPANWKETKFTVVDAGNNKVAFHNHVHNRFLMVEQVTESNFIDCPPDPNIFPQPTEYQITQDMLKGTGTVDPNVPPASALPSSWQTAMFEVKGPGWGAEQSEYENGPHVGLYAPNAGKYLRMNFCCNNAQGDTGRCMYPSTVPPGLNDMGTYFRVVSAFHDLVEPFVGASVALHNSAHNVFLKTNDAYISTSPIKAANEFPDDWRSEKFFVTHLK